MIFVVLQGGIPTILPGMSSGRLLPVFIMYLIAGYIKRFRKEKKNSAGKHFSSALLFYILLFASFYLLTLLGVKLSNQTLIEYRYFYRPLNSPFIVVICTELFITMLETDIAYNKIINTIASCTFGVYLIHANRLFQGVFQKCFPIYKEERSICIFLYSVIAVLLIYVFCTLVDLIRMNTFGKLWNYFLDRNLHTIKAKILYILEKITPKCVNALTVFYTGKK